MRSLALQFPTDGVSSCTPTYGVLIDLLDSCGGDVGRLVSEFKELYPSVPVGSPRRFHDTVRRIAAPTRPSLIGGQLQVLKFAVGDY